MSNVTYPPKKVNNSVNSIFNTSDYAVTGNDLKYVKLTGSTMTGGLACLGLTTNGTNLFTGTNQFNTNISLPIAYNSTPNTAVPTISQLGGTNKQVITSAAYSASTISNIKTISVNQGCYLLIYRLVLTNTSASAITLTAFSGSISTTNNALDEDYRVSDYSSQTLAATNGQTSVTGSFYYQLNTGTSSTLYLNYFATASGSVNISGYIQAVRIG